MKYKASLFAIIVILTVLAVCHNTPGSHQESLHASEKYILWCAWWVGLGILSSVGLGTGLHTFLLYLGPHIAAVTMAAYECGTTDFPSPPYPSQILCPSTGVPPGPVTIWTILSKV